MTRKLLFIAIIGAVMFAITGLGNGTAAQETKYKFDKPDTAKGWKEDTGCPKISIIKANKPDEKEKKYPKCVDTEEEAAEFKSIEQLATLATLWEHANRTGRYIDIIMDIPANPYLNCQGFWTNIGAPYYNFNDIVSSTTNYCQGMDLYPDADLVGTPEQFCSGGINYVGDYINDRTTSVRFRGFLAVGCAP